MLTDPLDTTNLRHTACERNWRLVTNNGLTVNALAMSPLYCQEGSIPAVTDFCVLALTASQELAKSKQVMCGLST